jgi:hypothetical protein
MYFLRLSLNESANPVIIAISVIVNFRISSRAGGFTDFNTHPYNHYCYIILL